jgi:DNA (cytosine-5)-methyltransferase 1
MHKANHPETRHYQENIWEVDPRDACGSRPVGLAWFSPACTHFSRAKGAANARCEEIRGLAWVVIRWAETVRPRVIILENVEEFATWGPLDANGLPDKGRAGETFRAWLAKLTDLGYALEFKSLVAADYGTPTTRKRLFLIARHDGAALVWPEATHGKHRPHAWRPAAEIIDWSLPCPSIFDRKKPLAEATQRRIAVGIRRYVLEAAQPFIVPVTHPRDARVHGVGEPLRTITAANRGELALVSPSLIQTSWGERAGQMPRALDIGKPLGTVVAGGVKHALVAAFIAKHYGGVVGHNVDRPIGTVTAVDHHSLAAAFLTKVRTS